MTLPFLFSLIGSLFLAFLGLRYISVQSGAFGPKVSHSCHIYWHLKANNLDLKQKADEDVGQKSFSSPLGHNPAVDVCIIQLKMMTSTNLTYKYDNKICLIDSNLTESQQICH